MKIDDVDINDVYEFMERGSMSQAPERIVQYLDLLDKVRGMHMRIDQFSSSEAIIKHLMMVDKLPRMKAKKVYEDAMEYFYCDTHISKAAFKNIYADKLDKLINFGMLTMKDNSDAQKVGKLILDVVAVRGLHEADKEELPEELFKQPIKVYTANAESLGLPAANRVRLRELIDKLPELTEKERIRIKQEADIDGSFKVFPDEQEDPRKS